MSDIHARQANNEEDNLEAATAFTRADVAWPFGPSFFLGHLGRFVRDHCPDQKENLPVVQIRLADGEALDLCHIIGVSPRWVMLAVRDAESHKDGMAIELLPFALVRSVSIRIRKASTTSTSLGFSQTARPEVITAETLLQSAMPPVHHGEH